LADPASIEAPADTAAVGSGRTGTFWPLPSRLIRVTALVSLSVALVFISLTAVEFSTPYGTIPDQCKSVPRPTGDVLTPRAAAVAAVRSYQALVNCFGGARGTFKGLYIGPAATAWPESQVLAGLLAVAAIPGTPRQIRQSVRSRMAVLGDYEDPAGGYYPGPPWFFVGGGVRKFDDNVFVSLDLIAAYQETHTATYLQMAEADARYVETGWSTDSTLPRPGGQYWEDPKFGRVRTAVTAAGAALLDVELYQQTGNSSYRDWAERDMRWLVGTLGLRNGLLADHISVSGHVADKVWSYNQGLAIGAWVALYSATGQSEYLRSAEDLAQRSLSFFGKHGLGDQGVPFNAVFFDYLEHLDKVAPNPQYRHVLQSYATYLFHHSNHADGVVRVPGSEGAPSQWLITQAAAVRVFAYLATSPPPTAGVEASASSHVPDGAVTAAPTPIGGPMDIPRKSSTIKGPADTFTGDVWVDSITRGLPPSQLNVATVRFAPGARSAWHSHDGGQTLYVTEGHGRVQVRGQNTVELTPGDVVFAPDGEEHWHGAAPDHFMTHLSITEGAPHWGTHVTDDEYLGTSQ
jgi:quercetin dioxygenase-like cupin family protein